MKRAYLILILFISLSCTDEREKVIGNYVQRIGNVKTDMSFSIKKIKELEPISANDSLEILTKELVQLKGEFIAALKRQVTINENQLEVLEYNIKNYQSNFPGNLSQSELEDRIENFNKHIEETKARIIDLTDQIEKVQNDHIDQIADFENRAGQELIELKSTSDRIKQYESNPELILANKCKVTYKIKNPLMNKVKQEVTTIFIFSPDNRKILGETLE